MNDDNSVMIPMIEAAEDKQLLEDIGQALNPPFSVNRTYSVKNIKAQLMDHISAAAAGTLASEPETAPEVTTADNNAAATAAADDKPAPRMLVNTKTKRKFIWSAELEKHPDLVEAED